MKNHKILKKCILILDFVQNSLPILQDKIIQCHLLSIGESAFVLKSVIFLHDLLKGQNFAQKNWIYRYSGENA